jgi:proline iminopeptidase
MDRMILDFEEVRKFLGFKDWIIMGHSFSGTMTTAYAMEHQNSIRGILMFNCSLNLKESITESWIPKAVDILGISDTHFYQDTTVTVQDKLNHLFPLLNDKGVMWKLAYADKEYETKMHATYQEIPNWNHDFSAVGMVHNDYLINFKMFTPAIKIPVLFFYGENDWTIGPEHYKGVLFPNMVLWKSSSGHIPFMENKDDLGTAMDVFLNTYKINHP